MTGIFSILASAISTLYPIFASYKAFEKYQKHALASSSGSISIAGINVPIISLIKRVSAGSNSNSGGSISATEDDLHDLNVLQASLLQSQKWLIYWIVYASYSLIESIFFLQKTIPLYSLLKCGLFIWMLVPIMTASPREVSVGNVEKEWEEFMKNGCGLIYYQYLKPTLSNEVGIFSQPNFDQWISQGKIFLNRLAPLKMASFAFTTRAQSSSLSRSENYEIENSKEPEEEFDIIDKPKESTDGTYMRKESTKGWLW